MTARLSREVMPCPVCRSELQLAERQGIEIDWCPGCRGVWLDRGELDKIVERSIRDVERSDAYDRPGGGVDARFGQAGARPRRRKSWIEELFD